MAQGWHGNSEGHRKAGRLGGIKSAAVRRRKAQQFREQVASSSETGKQKPKRPSSKAVDGSSGISSRG